MSVSLAVSINSAVQCIGHQLLSIAPLPNQQEDLQLACQHHHLVQSNSSASVILTPFTPSSAFSMYTSVVESLLASIISLSVSASFASLSDFFAENCYAQLHMKPQLPSL